MTGLAPARDLLQQRLRSIGEDGARALQRNALEDSPEAKPGLNS